MANTVHATEIEVVEQPNWVIESDAFAPQPTGRLIRGWDRARVTARAPRLLGQKVWKKIGVKPVHVEDEHDDEQEELLKEGVGARKRARQIGARENISDAVWADATNTTTKDTMTYLDHDSGIENEIAINTTSRTSTRRTKPSTHPEVVYLPRKRTNSDHIITPKKSVQQTTVNKRAQSKPLAEITNITLLRNLGTGKSLRKSSRGYFSEGIPGDRKPRSQPRLSRHPFDVNSTISTVIEGHEEVSVTQTSQRHLRRSTTAWRRSAANLGLAKEIDKERAEKPIVSTRKSAVLIAGRSASVISQVSTGSTLAGEVGSDPEDCGANTTDTATNPSRNVNSEIDGQVPLQKYSLFNVEAQSFESVPVDLKVEATRSEKTAPKYVVLKDTGFEGTASEDATAEDTAKEDMAAEETATEDTAAEDTATEDTATEDTATEDTATEDTAVEDSAVKEIAAEETAMEDKIMEDAAVEDTIMEKTATECTALEVVGPEAIVADDTAAEDSAANGTATDDAVIEGTDPEKADLEGEDANSTVAESTAAAVPDDSAEEDTAAKETAPADLAQEATTLEDATTQDMALRDEVEEAVLEVISTEETAGEDTLTEGMLIKNTYGEEILAGDTHFEEVASETSVVDIVVQYPPTEDAPAEDIPVEDSAAQDVPAEDTSTEDVPAETPVRDIVEDSPTDGRPAEETAEKYQEKTHEIDISRAEIIISNDPEQSDTPILLLDINKPVFLSDSVESLQQESPAKILTVSSCSSTTISEKDGPEFGVPAEVNASIENVTDIIAEPESLDHTEHTLAQDNHMAAAPIEIQSAIDPVAVYDHDDTDMLRNFLTRVNANKAAKKSSKRKCSLPHSPLKIPLEDLDNDISPSTIEKSGDGNATQLSPPKRRKRGTSLVQNEEPLEPRSCRRSTRIRIPPKDPPGAPSFIPVRRLGPEADNTVNLRRNEEKELATLTRINTRKNKGISLTAPQVLAMKAEERENPVMRQRLLKEVFDEKMDKSRVGKDRKGRDKKVVTWAEELAQFQIFTKGKEKLKAEPETEIAKEEKTVVAGAVEEKKKGPVRLGSRSKATLGVVLNGTPAPKRKMRGRG